MKKRWGKPITQVQRFVPQYCQTPCDTYDLRPTGLSANIKIDYNGNNKYDSGIGEGTLNPSAQSDVKPTSLYPLVEIEASGYAWYKALYNGYTNYLDTRYFESIAAPSIKPLYYYRKAFYTGKKNQS